MIKELLKKKRLEVNESIKNVDTLMFPFRFNKVESFRGTKLIVSFCGQSSFFLLMK